MKVKLIVKPFQNLLVVTDLENAAQNHALLKITLYVSIQLEKTLILVKKICLITLNSGVSKKERVNLTG